MVNEEEEEEEEEEFDTVDVSPVCSERPIEVDDDDDDSSLDDDDATVAVAVAFGETAVDKVDVDCSKSSSGRVANTLTGGSCFCPFAAL